MAGNCCSSQKWRSFYWHWHVDWWLSRFVLFGESLGECSHEANWQSGTRGSKGRSAALKRMQFLRGTCRTSLKHAYVRGVVLRLRSPGQTDEKTITCLYSHIVGHSSSCPAALATVCLRIHAQRSTFNSRWQPPPKAYRIRSRKKLPVLCLDFGANPGKCTRGRA